MAARVSDPERALVSSVLVDPKKIPVVMGIATPEMFLQYDLKSIYQACIELSRESKAVDVVTLTDRLAKVGIGAMQISDVLDSMASAQNAEHYAGIVARNFTTRDTRSKLVDAVARIDAGHPIEEISSGLFSLVREGAAIGSTDPKQVHQKALQKLEDIQTGRVRGFVATGFKDLDRFSPAPDELIVVGARPSVGKTSLAIALAENMSKEGPVLFLSCEMSAVSIQMRRLSAMSGVDFETLRTKGKMTDKEWSNVALASAESFARPFYIVDKKNEWGQVLAEIYRYQASKGIKAAIIDHLHLLGLPPKEKKHEALGEFTKMLAHTSKELGVAVFLLCQLNRQFEGEQTKGQVGSTRPKLKDLRESGDIEQNADVVWLLHRPGRAEQVAAEKMEIITAKNRNGPVGVVTLNVDLAYGRYY